MRPHRGSQCRAPPRSAAQLGPTGIRRTLVNRKPTADPAGWETCMYLIELSPGVAAPPHVRPAIGIGLVLDGRFESAFGDEPVVEVQAGQAFVDQAATTHRMFRNPSPDRVLRFVVSYTLRAGEPALAPAP
jgi:Cupin domain